MLLYSCFLRYNLLFLKVRPQYLLFLCAKQKILKFQYDFASRRGFRQVFQYILVYQLSRGWGRVRFLFDLIYDCDLLIIDDLGTEFNTQYTQAAFFDILNTRINEGKKTIISTNLSFEELRDMYSPRTASRIAGVFTLLHIFGEDIRIKKKLQG